jgi:cell division protein ZapA (FtsZ GTPase activity inhibitor)
MRPKQHLAQMPLPLVIDHRAELREKVFSADVNNMTPLEALNCLAEFKSMAEKVKRQHEATDKHKRTQIPKL